jgi:outer membrane lipoprotein carrier protein
MSPLTLVLLLGALASPAVPAPHAEKKVEEKKVDDAKKAEPKKEEPKKEENDQVVVQDKAPMEPEIAKAVEAMQRFYEGLKDFQADFKQVYTYKTFGRKTEATGKMKFMKQGGSMRWDYAKPDVKVFVVSNEKVYAYDQAAKLLTVSRIAADRLSASITFLWGTGRLDREFRITRATRKDLKDGIALELTPKVADPRFQKVFFLLDPKTFSVKASVVVDPDGSENHMTFTNPKQDSGFGTEAFKIEPPADTQIKRMDG